MDFSTIDLAKLTKLPRYELPQGFKLQDSSGNGCAGDAPGYPTYYTRSVYTSRGDNPRHGPQMVITHDGTHYVVETEDTAYEQRMDVLRGLWVPLPIDHPRTRLWIEGTYQHHKSCYQDVSKPVHDRGRLVIFPVPKYELRSFVDDRRWNDEYRAELRAEIEAHNAPILAHAARIATPENHHGAVIIRRFYPDQPPDTALIANPPVRNVGMWWETEAEQPSEEDCAKSQRWGHKHPFNGSRCQWCGRYYDEK